MAFITDGGFVSLAQTFKDLEARNVKGKILTTDYLAFSDPDALDKINDFKNIELKMHQSNNGEDGFHTKGYIFKTDSEYHVIVGSSNLTQGALTKNVEWNTSLRISYDENMRSIYFKNLIACGK